MNTLELSKVINRTGVLAGRRNEFSTSVRIVDARVRWDKIDYLVTPLSGHGEVWVDSERVTLDEVNQ